MNKIIIANFKMNKTIQETTSWVNEFLEYTDQITNKVIVCPSFVSLYEMSGLLKDTEVELAGQNCSDKSEGAYTGEVSSKMLRSAGAKFVVLGHSERRRYFKETDSLVNAKLKEALSNGLGAIVCLADDGRKGFERRISRQIKVLFDGVVNPNIIIAFEPSWAIGTGVAMDADEVDKIAKSIKRLARKTLGFMPNVIYGGSLKSDLASEFLAKDNIDGLFVGGASKNASEFAKFCLAK